MNAEPVPAPLDALTDEYEILRELGRGGTAVVYLARHRASGDEVAIKLVRDQFAHDEEAVKRLAREARFVAQLHHPNVVTVRDVLDLGEGNVALVMTHVPGRTLRQILRDEGALPPDRVSRILRDLALALDAAHEVGIVHRDVKPENVFVTDDDRAVLADFGIARSMSPETQQLTMHGVAIGTPAYMAPEQIDGDALDARADIYSLGLLGWEMITGRRPFAGEALYSVLYHQKHVQLEDPRDVRQDVPASLVGALAGAVEKERDARWTSAEAFLAALDSPTSQHEWPASPVAGAGTVRVQRPMDAVPAESVVAIDWREAMTSEPIRTLASGLTSLDPARRRRRCARRARHRRRRGTHSFSRREQGRPRAGIVRASGPRRPRHSAIGRHDTGAVTRRRFRLDGRHTASSRRDARGDDDSSAPASVRSGAGVNTGGVASADALARVATTARRGRWSA